MMNRNEITEERPQYNLPEESKEEKDEDQTMTRRNNTAAMVYIQRITATGELPKNSQQMQLLSSIFLKNSYSRLSLSRIPRDSLKHFEISVPRHIRVERVRKTIN